MSELPFRILDAGDSAVIVEFDNRIDSAVNAHVVALAEALSTSGVTGVRETVPTFRSVAVYFDPLVTDYGALVGAIQRSSRAIQVAPDAAGEPIRIPVCYGGAFGMDLPAVAEFARMSEADVVAVHAGGLYRVFMLGFAPGFGYMGVVDDRIAVPRRDSPRLRVAAGSVGIAGRQTGVYPSELPGGWQIIGRTPMGLVRRGEANPFVLKAGDAVRFYPISRDEFDRWPSA